MKIFVVDSAAKELMSEVRLVKGIVPDCELKSFQSSLEALGAAREAEVEVALVSTKMPELEGLDLGLYRRHNRRYNRLYNRLHDGLNRLLINRLLVGRLSLDRLLVLGLRNSLLVLGLGNRLRINSLLHRSRGRHLILDRSRRSRAHRQGFSTLSAESCRITQLGSTVGTEYHLEIPLKSKIRP